ncbi:MAG TPA: hypothetical protein VFE33_12790 [Thermoanaerobaculia bacterium]|nr:hypothetical protein [Thermoanaerobaculia bacterium]
MVAVLRLHLPGIETVLSKGGTAPLDFTLHDEDHAFRVAQRMVQVIPEGVLPKLSIPELALLLLSAYLHDIGMTPERGQVAAHYNYLTIAAPGLTPQEQEEFELWLAEQNRPVTPPMWTEAPTLDQLALAAELVTYYCRYKHNDWSKDWIEKYLPARTEHGEPLFSRYPSWREDLIDVCQSHHWGIERLLDEAMDPKLLSSTEIVHLRYLACVLRVADVLDIDPERTPTVVLRHRDIAERSRIYWWKDQGLALTIHQDDRRIAVRARPKSAFLHRAVLDTAAGIEAELRLCRKLDAQKPFRYLPAHSDLQHAWDLDASLYTDVRPYKDAYVYIEGSFRPNTEKLLELLGGTALYEEPLSAVRELLQNAFDAVREHIASERLDLNDFDNPSDPKWEEELGRRHLVELTLEPDPKESHRWWLDCSDDGSGMTKEIIENHLLVSGTVTRPDLTELERSCKKKGFAVGRTAKFGIGVLSYFMIADRIEITTQRNETWAFTTEGVGSFGELRPEPNQRRRGTTVRLRLREDLDQEGALSWFGNLEEYVKETVVRIPCRLQVAAPTLFGKIFEAQHGWFQSKEELRQKWLGEFRDEEIVSTLSWREEEGVLLQGEPGGPQQCLARYRLQLPVWRTIAGDCRLHLQLRHSSTEADFEVVRHPWGELFTGGTLQVMSFRGMATEVSEVHAIGGVLQIDWISGDAGSLSVNRNEFVPTPAIEDLLRQKISAVLQQSIDSAPLLDLLNFPNQQPRTFAWLMVDPESAFLRLRPVRFPAIHGLFVTLEPQRSWSAARTISWRGKEVDVVSPLLGVKSDKISCEQISWRGFMPNYILYTDLNNRFELIPLWSDSPPMTEAQISYCRFPPEWINLLYATTDLGIHLNPDHELIAGFSLSEVWKLLMEGKDQISSILQSVVSKNALWGWIDVGRQRPETEPWQAELERPVLGWEGTGYGLGFLTVRTQDYTLELRRREDIEIYLQPPHADWQLKVGLREPQDNE